MKFEQPIYVTRPTVAPLSEYVQILEAVWESNHYTNNGTQLKRLEHELCEYLAVRNMLLVSNGTIAIQLALRKQPGTIT